MSDTEEEPGILYKPSFVLIAIDTDPSMFVKKESDDVMPFKDCISACYNLSNSLIFTQNKRSWSPFGVVLAREDSSASFVDFNDNILDSIKLLKDKNGLSDEQLTDLYQRKGSLDLSAFFLFCKKKFKEVQSVYYKRTIIYITNDDDPVRGDKSQRFAVLNEAKNFEANGINFEMVTMREDFDYNQFYNELFSVMKVEPVETIIEDEEGLLEKLSSSILVRYYQTKMIFFPFLDDQTRFIRTKQKSFIQEEKIYNNAYVSSEGKPVKKVSQNTADTLKKYKLKFNMEPMFFEPEEYLEVKSNDWPIGYSLIHVSNRVTDVGLVLTHPVILEVDPKEDLNYFDSFWQYCVDKNKVLVCVRKRRRLDKIRFVELIPKFANNSKIFIVKTIPFNNEHKYPPSKMGVKETPQYSAEQVEITNSLIAALTFDYHPKMFSNPVTAKKKAYLRSKLLEVPKEETEDVTLDNKGIDKSLGDVEKYKRLFGLGEETAKKRKAPTAADKSKKKK